MSRFSVKIANNKSVYSISFLQRNRASLNPPSPLIYVCHQFWFVVSELWLKTIRNQNTLVDVVP